MNRIQTGQNKCNPVVGGRDQKLFKHMYCPSTIPLRYQVALCRPIRPTKIICDQGPPSSGSTGSKALSYLVLIDIYWTHKWYISVSPKIDQLTFSDSPPLLPVSCNHSWMGFKLGRTNTTHLRRMSATYVLDTPTKIWYIGDTRLRRRGIPRWHLDDKAVLGKDTMQCPLFGWERFAGKFLGNNINTQWKETATQSPWCTQLPLRWRELLW